ncbi:Kelch motif family protein [Histomonas meleagridis]|nr:Kelch motif family protein [Histomonas meleagridis]
MGEYFAVIRKGQPTQCYDAADFVNLSTKQISESFGLIGELIFIRTPNYIEVLPFSCCPLKTYPQLIINYQCSPYEIPKYSLSVHPANEFKTLTLRISISNPSEYEIPSFMVPFNLDFFKNATAVDVKNKIKKDLDIAVLDSSLYINDQFIPETFNAASLLQLGKTQQIIFKCTFTEEALNRIKHRTFILKEIVTTEQSYLHNLSIITNYWEKTLRAKKILPENHLQIIFKDISSIFGVHMYFCEHLQQAGTSYSSEISIPFIEFIPAFSISKHYVSEYPSIIEVLNLYKNTNVHRKLLQLAKAIDGRDLHSYLITPVQRIPRYILFIRDLIKYTPKSHPDSKLLPIVSERIQEMTSQFDSVSELARKQAELMHIQQGITNGFIFLDIQRDLVFEAKVNIQSSSRNQHEGNIYLFSDLLVIIQQQEKNRYKGIFDCPISKFSLIYQWPELNSIIIDSSNKSYITNKKGIYTITFNNENDMKELFKCLYQMRQKYKLFCNEKFTIDWENVEMKTKLIPFINPKAVSVNDVLYIITGIDKDFDIYKLQSQKLIHVIKLPTTINDIIAIPFANYIYIFSYNELYKFDSINKVTTKVELNGDQIQPRKYCTMILYKTNLIIYGGKSLNSSTCFNDTIIINLENNNVKVYEGGSRFPYPRYKHASILDGNRMLVYGGINNRKTLKRFDELNLDTLEWKQLRKVFLPPRKCHSLISFDKYIGIFGGSMDKTQILDLTSLEIYDVAEFGNVCSHPNSTTLVSNGSIYLISGSNDKKNQFSAIFKIHTPLTLNPVDVFRNQNLFDYQTRRTSGDLFTGNHNLDEEIFNRINIRKRPKAKERSFTRKLTDEKRPRLDNLMIKQQQNVGKTESIPIRVARKQSIDAVTFENVQRRKNSNVKNEVENENENDKLLLVPSNENLLQKLSFNSENMSLISDDDDNMEMIEIFDDEYNVKPIFNDGEEEEAKEENKKNVEFGIDEKNAPFGLGNLSANGRHLSSHDFNINALENEKRELKDVKE